MIYRPKLVIVWASYDFLLTDVDGGLDEPLTNRVVRLSVRIWERLNRHSASHLLKLSPQASRGHSIA